MKLSFEGVRSNALRQLRDVKRAAAAMVDSEDEENDTWAIECCISAYHDCLLGIMSGKVSVDEVKDFLLHGKTTEEIGTIPYCGDVVDFSPASEAA